MNSHLIRKWLIAGALLMGVAGLGFGLLGRVFSPLDTFAHFTPHFASVLLSGLLAFAFRRHAIAILIIGAVVTIGFSPFIAWGPRLFSEVFAARTKPALSSRSPKPLKIISINSWHGHPTPDDIVSYIKAEDADFVVLLEFGPNKLKFIRALAGQYPWSAHCAQWWYCAVAVLSKHPMRAHGSGGPKTAIPAYAWMTVDVKGRELTIIGTHLHRPIDGMNRHRRQLLGLSRLAGKFSGNMLVAGDFNTTIWADSYRLFKEQSGLDHMVNYLPSWPARFPQLAIDHIFYSGGLTVREARTGPNIGSDHLPLLAAVIFNDKSSNDNSMNDDETRRVTR